MAGNTFDFELNADDKVSQEIANIEARLAKLNPALFKTREGLQLGGKETLSGLRGINDGIRDISDGAKSGVQNIGDMIPPLKNFGALLTKYSSIGGIGALFASGDEIIKKLANDAHKTKSAAKDAGMTIEEQSRLSGTLIQRGVSKDDANAIINETYENFSNAAREGDDHPLNAAMASIGAKIIQKEDGTIDMEKTLLGLEKALEKIPESRNYKLRNTLKISPELLALLRTKMFQQYLDDSDKTGLTEDPEYIKQMAEIHEKRNKAGAKNTGLVNKTKSSVFNWFTTPNKWDIPDGDVVQAIDNVNTGREYDDAKGKHYSGDKRKDIYNRARRDQDFKKNLSFLERLHLSTDYDDPKLREKLYAHYEAEWEQLKKAYEAAGKKPKRNINDKIPEPPEVPEITDMPNTRGFRNKNPGNVRHAPNDVGRDYKGDKEGFSIFSSHADGNAALARQLMLDGDKGFNTIESLLYKYASPWENDTESYIGRIAEKAGFKRDEQLDMHDPEILKRLMSAIINHENGAQPFSEQELYAAIHTAITDPQWGGLRNPQKLRQQREELAMSEEQAATGSTAGINSPKTENTQLVDAIAALTKMLSEHQEKGTIEIALSIPELGQKQILNITPKGRVTKAMAMS